ncbi:MAG: hypothetical protein Q9196_004031 [Gyalolechia fulgens]
MAAFYHDSKRRTLFHERANRFGQCAEPSTCEVGLLEWSPGERMPKRYSTVRPLLTTISGYPLGTAEIIRTNAQALLSRSQPRIQIVLAPLDIAHHANGAGIQALFDHFAVPSDFVSQRIESVTHSFSAVHDGSSYYSYFHFLCKNVTISSTDGRSPGIADPRGAVLSQGDWTWIRTSVFMRWDNCGDKDKATVALVIFSASPEMRERCQRLWETDLSAVLIDPFGLFVICLDELWVQAQGMVKAVGGVFNEMERTALDLAASSATSDGDGPDFVGLHNIAKHIIYLKENSEAALMTISRLETFHGELLKRPPRGQDAIPTMRMTNQMLAQKVVQFEGWKLRMTSLEQRMQNIINLSFNLVTQHDSHILKNDSKSMKAIATVTMLFLPLATIAAIFGSEFFKFDDHKHSVSVAHNFWIFWALTGPLTVVVSFFYPSSALGEPVQYYRFHIRDSPSIDLDILYCPGLLIRSEALSHTLYRAILAMNQIIEREGPNAPLEPGGAYTTPEERGYNCLFMVESNSEAGIIRVGVVVDVLNFLRRWMLRQQHLGSTAFIVHVDHRRVAIGGVRPIVDQALLSA